MEKRFLMKRYLTREERVSRMEQKIADNASIFVKALIEGKRISLVPSRTSFRTFICEEMEEDLNANYSNGIGGGMNE